MIGRIIKLWPIFLALITLLAAFVKIDTTVNALEQSVALHHSTDDARDGVMTRELAICSAMDVEIKNRLIRIENKLDGLR